MSCMQAKRLQILNHKALLYSESETRGDKLEERRSDIPQLRQAGRCHFCYPLSPISDRTMAARDSAQR